MKMTKRERINPELEKLKSKAAVGKKRLQTFEIEESDMLKFKSKAALNGVKMADIIRQWIKEYIE